MVWNHTSTALVIVGMIIFLIGGLFAVMVLYCSYVTILRECSAIGLRYLLVVPGIIFFAVGVFLHGHREKALSDAGSMLRYSEIDSRCPECYAQGVVKAGGLFTHTMECLKCGRRWRVPDL